MLRNDIGGLHPAKFHRGLLQLAERAGAIVHAETPVLRFKAENGGFEIETARGKVQADHVIVGTNGYTDGVDPRPRRRLVPVRSRIIATAPLSNNLMSELMPKGVMCSETRKLHDDDRPSPDGRRILFGGRDGTIAGEPVWPTDSLKRALADIFPVLDGVDITHSWYGHSAAMNRDMIPRIFSRHGTRYAAGYCGSGVVWARWAGQKAALQILGDGQGEFALDFRAPPAVPLFNGKAWFLPMVFAWLTLRDRLSLSARETAGGRRQVSVSFGADTMTDATYPTTCWECSTCCGALATVRDGRSSPTAPRMRNDWQKCHHMLADESHACRWFRCYASARRAFG